MDFKTFKETAKRLPSDISVLMRGPHGIGKSEVVYQLGKDFDLPVMERRLSQITEGDVLGLPHKVDRKEGNKIVATATRFLPMDWFVACMDKPHLIFLDELDRSCQEVQQAVFELILDRSIQGNKIHPGCRIYVAINGGPKGAAYNVMSFDPALLDRLWTADMTPSVEEWIEWAKKDGKILPDIVDFIDREHNHLEFNGETIDPNNIYPSRRSWKRLSDTLRANPDVMKEYREVLQKDTGHTPTSELFLAMCRGFIGIESTSVLNLFMKDRSKMFTVQDVLDDFSKNKKRFKKARVEELNSLIEKIFENSADKNEPIWSNDQIDNLRSFFEILPNELRLSLWAKMLNNECKQENLNNFGEKAKDILLSFV